MRLKRVNIENFRSLRNLTLQFDPSCRVLVGINESGKSNILAALSLLDENVEIQADDVREVHPDEDPVTKAFVRFVFEFDRDDRRRSYAAVLSSVLASRPKQALLNFSGREVTLEQFVNERTEANYYVDVIAKTRQPRYWTVPVSGAQLGKWKKPNANCPTNVTIPTKTEGDRPLTSFSLLWEEDLEDFPAEYFDDALDSDLVDVVSDQLVKRIKEERPQCLLWTYSADNLLPSRVQMSTFRSDPDTCRPLKHMFALAGVDDIDESLDRAEQTAPGVRNLLNRVADRATKHLHSTWKEHTGVSIRLAPNGGYIDIGIRDRHNEFDFARRSDGFKRFVTFLLMVSARQKTNNFKDIVYLHDEPDLGLHPSGARYLRNELIRISKTNTVVFSTHSPFMIDKTLIRRHLIVEKKAEITTIREVNESNVTDEEVIFNALGASIFESLRPKNIVFEGWRDKELFRVAMSRVPKDHSHLKPRFEGIGRCHTQGVKDIKNLAPMLELADRKWVVLSDADGPAREQQRTYNGTGPWLRYDELTSAKVVTAEDFLDADYVKETLAQVVEQDPGINSFGDEDFDGNKGWLQSIRAWLLRSRVEPSRSKEILDATKEKLFANLKPAQVTESYYEALKALADRLDRLS